MKTRILLATLSLALSATAFAQDNDRPRRPSANDEFTNREAPTERDSVRPRARRFQGEFAPGQGRYRQGDQVQERRRQRLRAGQNECQCPNCPAGRANLRNERAGLRQGGLMDRPPGPRAANRGQGMRAGRGRGPGAADGMGPRGRGFGGPPGRLDNRPNDPRDLDNGPGPDDR